MLTPRRKNANIEGVESSRFKRRSLTAEYFEYSTLHGLPEVFRENRPLLKVAWSLIFLGALGAAIYGCYAIIAEYLQSPVVVSYMVHESDSDEMVLPDIVICPFNRFNKSFLNEHNVSYQLRQYFEVSFPLPLMVQFQHEKFKEINFSKMVVKNEVDNFLQRINLSFTEFVHRATLDCSALIRKPANCSNFETVMTSSGKCFRIPPSQNQTAPGFGAGTQIVLSLPKENYSPGITQLPNDGILLKLAETGKGIDQDMIFIPKGVHAILPLKATRYEFINDPPRYECLDSVEPDYSRVRCFDECKIEPAENACNCSVVASQTARKQLCTPFDTFFCFFPQIHDTLSNATWMRGCKRRCQPACLDWKYQPTLSYTQFPSPEVRAFVENDEEWQKLHNYIIVDLFFEHLEYTLIKHFPSMTAPSFIAQLGGQVSLWVGGSILTLVQILFFFLQLMCPKWSRKHAAWRFQESLPSKTAGHRTNSSGRRGGDRPATQTTSDSNSSDMSKHCLNGSVILDFTTSALSQRPLVSVDSLGEYRAERRPHEGLV